MNKSTGILLALMSLFLGIIIGFMWAPAKKGIYCGNNNGNTHNYNGFNDDEDTIEEDSLDF